MLNICMNAMKITFAYNEEKEVLRGPKEILPTKTTNLIDVSIIGARNTLEPGSRIRGDVGVRI